MHKIQLVDLLTQYDKIKEEIDQAVLDVIRSGAYINGPEVKAFQSDLETYLGVKHVVPCANGTDALQIALMALGLEPGDEVITPSFTYIATAEVIALLRLKPVFAEVNPDTFCIDPKSIEEKITDKTKAIVPVHMYGQCADMEPILQLAAAHNLPIIEDTAQATGSAYTFADGTVKKAGTIGEIGTTSFFPSKNLGCFGDGGALFTNDDELAEKLRMIANHGQKERYYHERIGVNSRLDSIQAAILRIKLTQLDEYIVARQQAADYYNKQFENIQGVTVPYCASNSTHGFHQYTLKLDEIDRDGMIEHLSAKEIPSNIYYPLPVHLQAGFKEYGYTEGSMPITEDLCSRVISLPIHTELTEEQLVHITSSFAEFVQSNSPANLSNVSPENN